MKKLFNNKKKFVIGLVHLLPSIGYPDYKGYNATLVFALNDLKALVNGGVDAVLIENDNDQPQMVTVTPEIVSFMTLITKEIVTRSIVPVGIEVLLNDPKASLSIAKLTGSKFIRSDYFVDRMSREEYGGEFTIDPKGILEFRKKIQAEEIEIFTDIQVKYAKLLEKDKTIGDSTKQAIEAKSDGVIVTGNFTADKPKLDHVVEAKEAAQGQVPIIIGSGFGVDNAVELLKFADGAIVGSSIKENEFNSPVSERKVRELMKVVNSTK